MQIKCLLELSCVSCSFSLSTCVRRSWVLAGGRYQIRLPSRAATNGPVANSGGSRKKRGNLQFRSFYSGHHVTPRGCWYSMKQDHQFLNKISTKRGINQEWDRPSLVWKYTSTYKIEFLKRCIYLLTATYSCFWL